MKKISAYCCFLMVCIWLLPACSLFRETTGRKTVNVPPPEKTKPAPVRREPPRKTVPPPFNVPAFAKVVRKPVYNVALFTPLYLDQIVDTAFTVNSNKPLPRYALPGLEFYEGVLMALDSLRDQGIALRLHLYDTKSATLPLAQRLRQLQSDSADLLIGAVNAEELKLLSDFAKQKQINFISATYPNDAGISDNPFLTIVNSTLRTHCFAMQDFAQEKFYNQQILVLRRDNAQEKRNAEYIQEAYRRMALSRKVQVKVVEWNDSTTAQQLAAQLSASRNNVIIVTALYADTAESIIRQLASLAGSYTINVIGMPTLDGQKSLLTSDFKGINIYYSTPYFTMRTDPASRRFMWEYFQQYHARPSDMTFKGFETLFYFGHLLHEDGLYFNKDMNDASGKFVTDYHFEPVYQTAGNGRPDYFENKHLYFIQVRDSVISRAN